jgi:hypothetical protein
MTRSRLPGIFVAKKNGIPHWGKSLQVLFRSWAGFPYLRHVFFFLATSSGSAAWSKSSELGAEKGHELGAEISGLLQKWQVQGG